MENQGTQALPPLLQPPHFNLNVLFLNFLFLTFLNPIPFLLFRRRWIVGILRKTFCRFWDGSGCHKFLSSRRLGGGGILGGGYGGGGKGCTLGVGISGGGLVGGGGSLLKFTLGTFAFTTG